LLCGRAAHHLAVVAAGIGVGIGVRPVARPRPQSCWQIHFPQCVVHIALRLFFAKELPLFAWSVRPRRECGCRMAERRRLCAMGIPGVVVVFRSLRVSHNTGAPPAAEVDECASAPRRGLPLWRRMDLYAQSVRVHLMLAGAGTACGVGLGIEPGGSPPSGPKLWHRRPAQRVDHRTDSPDCRQACARVDTVDVGYCGCTGPRRIMY